MVGQQGRSRPVRYRYGALCRPHVQAAHDTPAQGCCEGAQATRAESEDIHAREGMAQARNAFEINVSNQGDQMTEQKEPRSLGEALPAEMTRVRDVVMPPYVEIGPAGAIALAMMRQSLDDAQRALAEGDVIAMIRCYEDLKGYSL